MAIGTTDLDIGGLGVGEGNVIAGGSPTIQIGYPVGAKIIGNNIGVGADNKANIGGTVGIEVLEGMNVSNVRVQILLNKIANHSQRGVMVHETENINFSRNSIFNNGALGIDLFGAVEDAFGVNANDNKDVDSGTNTLQNFPVLKKVTPSVAGTTIKGNLHSTPNKTFHIELFTNPGCDPSGHGEGKKYLGIVVVTTNNKGNAQFTFTTNKILTSGTQVTATATNLNNKGALLNTSEFSKCKAAS